jgi:hypothetical protein
VADVILSEAKNLSLPAVEFANGFEAGKIFT